MALITGGDSGIGRAVAIAFAREGADLAISYLPEEEADAKEAVAWVEKAGRKALALPGDIGEEETCQAIIDKTVKELGSLDVLVNNAAYQNTHESIDDWSSKEWDHTFRTNIYAMFYLCKAALRVMRPGSFTKGLSELAIEKGIRVNAVAPGPVWTPLIPSTMAHEKVEWI